MSPRGTLLNREWSPPADSCPGEHGNEDSQDCPTEDSHPEEKYQLKGRENETTDDDDHENNEVMK